MKKLMILCTLSLCLFQHLSLANASKKMQVVVSILPQTYFVEQIGGNLVDVMCLLPEGGSPHIYEPTPQQMKFLSLADMYVRIKVEFENAWWNKIVAANSDILIVDSTQNIEFIKGLSHSEHGESEAEHHGEKETAHDEQDPHIWLSPQRVKTQVENIYQGLITVDPQHRDIYKANKEAFVQSIGILDNEIKTKLANVKSRHFMVFHPVWSYFAKDYNLKQIPIEFEGKEPSAREMVELMKMAKKKGIAVIFIQPQTSRRSADIIAKQIGAKVKILDPLAAQWLKNMRLMMDTFLETLSQ